MDQIEAICDRSIWIQNGRIERIGQSKEVNKAYLYAMEQARLGNIGKTKDDESEKKSEEPHIEDKWGKLRNVIPVFADETASRLGTGEMEFTNLQIFDMNGNISTAFKTGDYIKIRMEYCSHIPGAKGNFGIGIFRDDGTHCYGTNIDIEHGEKIETKSQGCVEVVIEKCMLLPGKYYLDIALDGDNEYFYDNIKRAAAFSVSSEKRDIGVARLATIWDAM